MRKATFLKAVAKYSHKVVKGLCAGRIDVETANDAMQDAVVSLIDKKKYLALPYEAIDNRVYTYLKIAAKFQVMRFLKRLELENSFLVSVTNLNTNTEMPKDDYRPKVKEATECPFCHTGELNMYKACGDCGTIIGQGKRVSRVHESVDDEELFEWPNLDMQIDVRKALAKLSPFEQRLVNAVIHGTETVDGIANVTGGSERQLWRVYAAAKRKLQESLLEYARK